MIEIHPLLAIPEHELTFTASRSSGPGGQHVNKVSSRVTLSFDVANSPSLSEAQRRRLLARLATRITKDGVLKLHCQQHRSQAANRAELVTRFVAVLRQALRTRRRRKPTAPTRAARERRLTEKRQRGEIKRGRRGPANDD